MITLSIFQQLFPKAKDAQLWVVAMQRNFPEYGIDTPESQAAFIAQCGHESGGWTVFEENLNYSQQGLRSVFKKYFPTDELAAQYARQPILIASRVYASRMGNGNEASQEGWKYRGRGPIQLTGKTNYRSFSADMLGDPSICVDNPDLVKEDKDVSLKSALWFWNKMNLNREANAGDIRAMTKKINGGYNGLEDRLHHYEKALALLNENPDQT